MGQQRPTHPTVVVERMMQSGTGPQLIAGHRIPTGTVRVAVAQARLVTVLVGQVSTARVAIGRRLFRRKGVSRGELRGWGVFFSKGGGYRRNDRFDM